MFLLALLIGTGASPSPIPNPINSNPPDLSWLGPTILAAGTIVVALIALLSALWSNRQKHKESMIEKTADSTNAKQPTVTDGWDEVRKARDEASEYYGYYRAFENVFWLAFSALRHLARLFRDTNPNAVLDQDIVDALAIVPPDTTPTDATK